MLKSVLGEWIQELVHFDPGLQRRLLLSAVAIVFVGLTRWLIIKVVERRVILVASQPPGAREPVPHWYWRG
jgi:hypothetical protein